VRLTEARIGGIDDRFAVGVGVRKAIDTSDLS
jgi:hypothetical protein